MKLRIKRFFIKFILFSIKRAGKLKGPLVFIGKQILKALTPLGKAGYGLFFNFYKVYFLIRRQLIKILPAKDILGISTNKFIIHAAIVVIALFTSWQNIYAHTGPLSDYGKKSILFSLTQPTDEEIIEGLPINSDIEGEFSGTAPFLGNFAGEAENPNIIGFVGTDYTPSIDTESTRTSIEYYIVQQGDTLGGIAERYSISLNTLLWANQLTERSYIRPGDKLTVLPVSGVSHTVKKGDTLAAIASKYSVKQEKIMEFNHLENAGALQVGQVLIIPEGKIVYVAPTPAYSSGFSSKSYSSSGELLWPVPSRRITQYFSWSHPAIDIGLPVGSRLVAAESGKVIYSGWGTGYGYEVLIDHGNGMKTRYAHNSRLYVRTGDIVERGELIALTGNTGWSTGPHLHFEVYIGSVRVNPLLYAK
ncbi:peptidoglycan DD-metalloendopeptidase family protein [Candidatus Parcubacteria bacterium]|nr:peptidoglycan DD-metalloendopeptidase family protein [Patescibacteria group bacterium]MCG2693967.1 peptidoglycan DD-metalloendopeptidase family protein [Candidatus Parcubacteria bacterium]